MYRDAYNYHYKIGDMESAKKIYQEIIEGYPVSDAADYAAIQLKTMEETGGVPNVLSETPIKKGSNAPLVVSIITLAITITILMFGILHIQKTENEIKSMSNLSLAQNKILIGNNDEALLILSELKIKNEDNIIPFVLASDIYVSKKDFKKAKHELQTFQRLNPDNKDVEMYLKRLDDKEALHVSERKRIQREKSEKLIKKNPIKRSNYFKEPEPKVRRVKKEEISYF